MIKTINVEIAGQRLSEVTAQISAILKQSQFDQGLCTIFIQHTSASLLIQENADPSVQRDLEHWINRLVPENDPLYTHTMEGPDDMPAHIKSMLTQTSLSIPFINGQLVLGTWQGIFVWEHRSTKRSRRLVIHLQSDS